MTRLQEFLRKSIEPQLCTLRSENDSSWERDAAACLPTARLPFHLTAITSRLASKPIAALRIRTGAWKILALARRIYAGWEGKKKKKRATACSDKTRAYIRPGGNTDLTSQAARQPNFGASRVFMS